jgi:hypothetical protein
MNAAASPTANVRNRAGNREGAVEMRRPVSDRGGASRAEDTRKEPEIRKTVPFPPHRKGTQQFLTALIERQWTQRDEAVRYSRDSEIGVKG